MLAALAKVGVGVTAIGQDSWARRRLRRSISGADADLFMGNAGTAIRPLTAALAAVGRTLPIVRRAAHA
jgi:3-phosphoshikimate 1-carboxyvinyltransferase